MIGILRKDFYLVRTQLWIFLGSAFFFTVGMTLSIKIGMAFPSDFQILGDSIAPSQNWFANFCTALVAFMVFLGCEALKGNLLLADQNRKSRHYLMATPLSIKGCVAAKYYECAIVSLFGFLYLTIFELVTVALTGQVADHSLMFTCLVFLGLFLSALAIPFYVLLGRNGMHVKTALILLLLFLVFLYGLFGDISPFLGKETFADRMQKAVLSSDNDAILSWILGVDYPKLLLLTLAPHLILLLYYVSYRITCMLYRRGVELGE